MPLLRSVSYTLALYLSSSFQHITVCFAALREHYQSKHVTSTQGMYQASGRRVTWKSNAELFACTS
jgi:hypothetical protein